MVVLVTGDIYCRTSIVQSQLQNRVTINNYIYIYIYIYIYRCLGVSPNRDERVGNPYKICQANPGADRKIYIKYAIYNIHGRSTHPLIVQIYTIRSASLCTGVFLYITGAAMPGK